MVKTKLTLLKVEVEVLSGDATELCQSSFRPSPKIFNTIDVVFVTAESSTMVNTVVSVSIKHESIIRLPLVCVEQHCLLQQFF